MLEPGGGRVPLRGRREKNAGLGFMCCCPALGLTWGSRPTGRGTVRGAAWLAHSRPRPEASRGTMWGHCHQRAALGALGRHEGIPTNNTCPPVSALARGAWQSAAA